MAHSLPLEGMSCAQTRRLHREVAAGVDVVQGLRGFVGVEVRPQTHGGGLVRFPICQSEVTGVHCRSMPMESAPTAPTRSTCRDVSGIASSSASDAQRSPCSLCAMSGDDLTCITEENTMAQVSLGRKAAAEFVGTF
jgi:hypothetical protein